MKTMPMQKRGEVTVYGLLVFCKKVGKDKVITALEEQHRALENMAANMWGDYETQGIAKKLDAKLLKQDEMLIKLRNLSDTDIDRLLKEIESAPNSQRG